MMRGGKAAAIAMRAPNQEIVIQTEPLGRIYKSKVAKIPFLRGLVILWDALGLGMRALTVSANMQTGEDEKLEGPTLYLILIAAIALAVLLFFIIPASLGQLASHYLSISQWWSNLLEGLVRLQILICYIWAVGKIPEIDRVFAYHGAEHKTINAFEAGAELTPDSVYHFSVEHPRCGTAFLLDVVLLSVILYSFLGPLSIAWRLASRILLIPIIAGIAYEYLRWTSNHLESPLVRLLIRPNLVLQRLTTREPTLAMLEVSIASFNAMRQVEQEKVVL
jgi:uncharacterized protein YqhQ